MLLFFAVVQMFLCLVLFVSFAVRVPAVAVGASFFWAELLFALLLLQVCRAVIVLLWCSWALFFVLSLGGFSVLGGLGVLFSGFSVHLYIKIYLLFEISQKIGRKIFFIKNFIIFVHC